MYASEENNYLKNYLLKKKLPPTLRKHHATADGLALCLHETVACRLMELKLNLNITMKALLIIGMQKGSFKLYSLRKAFTGLATAAFMAW